MSALAQWDGAALRDDWLAFGALTILATLSQWFKALFRTHYRSDQGNLSYSPLIAFLFAGALLLPAKLFVWVALLSHLLDWLKARWTQRPQLAAWYIQPFNIAVHVLCGLAAAQVYAATKSLAGPDLGPLQLTAATLAAGVYVGLNHLQVGLVLWLARGVPLAQSGVFNLEHLLPDFIMTGLGYAVTLLWTIGPWLILPALAPLLLIQRALRVPQLEKEARLFETVRDGLVLVNTASGRILDVNPAVSTLLGCPRAEFLGKEVWAVRPFNELPSSSFPIRALLANDTRFSVDLPLCGPVNRPGWIEVSGLTYRVGSERVAQLTLRDITERKQAEATLLQDKEQLEASVAARTQEVREAYQRLQLVSQQLVRAQEDERTRVARELHDEIGQALTVLKIDLQTLQRQPETRAVAPQVERAIHDVELAMGQVRELSRELRPSVLDDLGLGAALRSLIDRQAEIAGFQPQVIIEPPDLETTPDVATTCFRVVQEALTNIMRHAQARHVYVELRQSGPELALSIRDDGVGFDPSLLTKLDGSAQLGLAGIQERVLLIGGQVSFHSVPGQGTLIHLTVPAQAGETSRAGLVPLDQPLTEEMR